MFNIKKIKYLLLGIISPAFMWGNSAFAADKLYSITDNSLSEIEKITVAGYGFVYFIGLLFAFFIFFSAIKRLLAHAKSPQDPRNSIGGVVVLFIAFAALSSLQSSISIGINTFGGDSGNSRNCFIYHDSVKKSTGGSFAENGSTCFDAKNSELTSELRKKLEDGGKTVAAEKIVAKLNLLFAILQVIGLAYFIKGIYTMKAIVEQTSQSTYPKVFVTLAVSSLVMDMPNTLEMIISTAKAISSVS